MNNPKLPHQIDTEDLLDALNDESDVSEQEEISEYFNDVIPFLSRFNIIPGENNVHASLIDKLYKAYSNNPVNKIQFALEINKHLPYYTNSKGKFFKININSINISKMLYNQLSKSSINKTKNQSHRKAFENFLKETNIQGGIKWCEGFIIYEAYRELCRLRRKQSRFSYPVFISMLSLYLPNSRRSSNRSKWFKINPEFICKIFTREQRDVIRHSRRKNG
jgi:hypothetical protein